MRPSGGFLWLAWGVLFASLLVWLAVPQMLPPRAHPWSEAQTAVAGFVLALLALVTAVGSFATRETLVRRAEEQRSAPAGATGGVWVRTRLVALWTLCALVGLYGGVLLRYSAHPAAATPYLVGAAALFVIHAPRPRLLARVFAEPAPQRRG